MPKRPVGVQQLKILPALPSQLQTCSALSPFWKTTILCRTSLDSILSTEVASRVRGASSSSAALPSYSRNWLHAFRLSAMAESGKAWQCTGGGGGQRGAEPKVGLAIPRGGERIRGGQPIGCTPSG
jgi:hypothetical protein